MSRYADQLRAVLRADLLGLLHEAPAYSLHEYILADLLAQANTPRPVPLSEEVDWLAGQALVTVEDLGAGRLLRLTERGADVAGGRASVSGVARAQPWLGRV
jgi:hypothetical protein